jgi:hypothetical protein
MSKEKEFKLPVTVLIGSNYRNMRNITRGMRIDPGYKLKHGITLSISTILTLFSAIENKNKAKLIEQTKISKPPVFVVAFWRSGTTLLHNLLCQNPDFAFVSTFQTVFPNHTLSNQWWLKYVGAPFIPEYRPADKVKLDWDNPQEEELSLGNMQENSYYNFMYFPNSFEKYLNKGLLLENMDEEELINWEETYIKLIKTALINTEGQQFVSKNPPNAFRITQLLKMFPDAKFINIERNEDEVIFSFKRFMVEVLKGTALQDFNEEILDKQVRELYDLYVEKYNKDKLLIPEGNLVKINYHEFVDHKIEGIKHVYDSLGLEGFEEALPNMQQYLEDTKDFKPWDHRKMHKAKR